MRKRPQLGGERGGWLGGHEARRMRLHQRHQAMFGRIQCRVVILLDLLRAFGRRLNRRSLTFHLLERRAVPRPGRTELLVDAIELADGEVEPHSRRRVHAG